MSNIFKPLKGYEGLYEINCIGIVKSVYKVFNNRIHLSVILSQSINKKGYKRVSLNHPDTKKKTWEIHKLVAVNFHSNPLELRCINHKDGNKLNNNYLNLEWCTHSHNTQHAFDTGLMHQDYGNGVSKIVLDINTGVFYGSVREVATLYGLNEMTLAGKLSGRRRNTTNFIYT